MMTLSAFRVDFPEFRTVSDAAVQSALDKAEKRTDAGVFGDQTDEYHGNRAADILISRPNGMSGRQVPEGEEKVNVYAQKCTELETLNCGFRGGAP